MQKIPENFNLKSFIDESKSRVKNLLDKLNWSEEYVMRENAAAKGSNKFEHAQKELPLPENCTSENSVVLELDELRQLVKDESVNIPEKFSDLQVNFTREQKLRIYEHVVACTGKCTEPEVHDSGEFGEIVAAKKREKKHKRRHRVSKPTHIEEVRALVDLQMQSLQQYLENQIDNEKSSTSRTDKEHRRPKKKSRSRSHERRRHKHRNRSESRSRSKHRSHKRRRSRSRSRDKRHTKHKKIRSRSRSHERKHSKKRRHNPKEH